MLLDYSPQPPTLQCSSARLWPKWTLVLRWSVFQTKKLLAFNYRRVCQNSSHHPTQHCLLPFSVIFKYYHTHFTFFSIIASTGFCWLHWKKRLSSSSFIVDFFVSSRHLPESAQTALYLVQLFSRPYVVPQWPVHSIQAVEFFSIQSTQSKWMLCQSLPDFYCWLFQYSRMKEHRSVL